MMFTKFLKQGLDLQDFSEKEKRLCFDERVEAPGAEAEAPAEAEGPKQEAEAIDYTDASAVKIELQLKETEAMQRCGDKMQALIKALPDNQEYAASQTALAIMTEQRKEADSLVEKNAVHIARLSEDQERLFQRTVQQLEEIFDIAAETAEEKLAPPIYVKGTSFVEKEFTSPEQVNRELRAYADNLNEQYVKALLNYAETKLGAGNGKVAESIVRKLVAGKQNQALVVLRDVSGDSLVSRDRPLQTVAEEAIQKISKIYGVTGPDETGNPQMEYDPADIAKLREAYGQPAEEPVVAKAPAPAAEEAVAEVANAEPAQRDKAAAAPAEGAADADAAVESPDQVSKRKGIEFLAVVTDRAKLNEWLGKEDNRQRVRNIVVSEKKEGDETKLQVSFKALVDAFHKRSDVTPAQKAAVQNNLSIGNLFTDEEIQKIIAVEDGRGGGIDKNKGKSFLATDNPKAKRGIYDNENNKYVAIYEGAKITMMDKPSESGNYLSTQKIEQKNEASFLAGLNGPGDGDAPNDNTQNQAPRFSDASLNIEQSTLDRKLEYASRQRVAILNYQGQIAPNQVYLYRGALLSAYEEYLKGRDGIISEENQSKLDTAKANTNNLDTITSALIKETTRQDKVAILRQLESNFEENFMSDCRDAVDEKGNTVATQEVQDADLIQDARESAVKSVAGGVVTGAGIVAKKVANKLLSKLPIFGKEDNA